MRGSFLLACLSAPLAVAGHGHFCRACADRAAALLVAGPRGDTALPALEAAPPPPAPVAALPFALSEVALTAGAGLPWRAQQTNLEYLLMLNVSSLAYNFRNTSGLPLQGATPFGGWETPFGPEGDDRGHFTGHWLSAAALAANSSSTPAAARAELRARSAELVDALGACQEQNAVTFPKFGPGYLSGAPTLYFDCLENLWRSPCRYMQVPYYNVHKIMAGLLDQHALLGSAPALRILLGMAAYFNRRIAALIATNGTATWEQVLQTEAGGMNDVMYKLFRLTRDPAHLRMAHLFDKQAWFAPMLNATDVLDGHHANTHLALAVGGAQRYAVIADAEYRNATDFFLRVLRAAHSYSTGGSNFKEFWHAPHAQGSSLFRDLGRSGELLRSHTLEHDHAHKHEHGRDADDAAAGHDNEESCTSYNFLKIARLLFEWSGRPDYLAMYNYVLNNGVLGIQDTSRPGVMIYLMPLGVGVTKGNSSRSWGSPLNSFWCCYGTAVESFAKLADSIFFRQPVAASGSDGSSGGALVVARLVSSVLASPGSLGLTQRAVTAPFNLSASITVDAVPAAGAAATTTLKVLIPPWAVGATVAVNGATQAAVAPGKFVALRGAASRGKWQAGDVVDVMLPMSITLRKLDDDRPQFGGMYSFVVGDTLLVGLEPSGHGGTGNELSVKSLDAVAWVDVSSNSTEEAPLRFVARALNRQLELMPLNEVVHERYTVYYNISVAAA